MNLSFADKEQVYLLLNYYIFLLFT